MTTQSGIEIGTTPYVAESWEIIQPGEAAIGETVDVGLVRKPIGPPDEPPVPIPSEVLPLTPVSEVPGKKRLILNIETTGYRPWEHRIAAIGLQDPMVPKEAPLVIMFPDEAVMISDLFGFIRDGGYNELVGYGLSFDYRFLLIKAMKYNVDCKEFYDMDLYDLMQAAAQGKFSFVYKPQSPPKLSELADYLWGYPKPFTDLEMIKYYKQGQFDKVIEFTSSQITRIMALYYLFRKVSETPFTLTNPGIGSDGTVSILPQNIGSNSKLTIPGVSAPDLIKLHCPVCLSDLEVTKEHLTEMCPVCGQRLERVS